MFVMLIRILQQNIVFIISLMVVGLNRSSISKLTDKCILRTSMIKTFPTQGYLPTDKHGPYIFSEIWALLAMSSMSTSCEQSFGSMKRRQHPKFLYGNDSCVHKNMHWSCYQRIHF